MPKVKQHIVANLGMGKEVCITKNVPEHKGSYARSVTNCIFHFLFKAANGSLKNIQ